MSSFSKMAREGGQQSAAAQGLAPSEVARAGTGASSLYSILLQRYLDRMRAEQQQSQGEGLMALVKLLSALKAKGQGVDGPGAPGASADAAPYQDMPPMAMKPYDYSRPFYSGHSFAQGQNPYAALYSAMPVGSY